jgi:hypothetical protein
MEHEASQTFAFADAWEGVPKYAYQVRRSEFDHALLQHARTRGVEVLNRAVPTMSVLNPSACRESELRDGRGYNAMPAIWSTPPAETPSWLRLWALSAKTRSTPVRHCMATFGCATQRRRCRGRH